VGAAGGGGPPAASPWAPGVALRASGKPLASLGCYRRALDIRPDDVAATGNLANALKDLQRYREAIELHQRVVAKVSTTAAWTNLGVALHDGGQLADFVRAIQRVVRRGDVPHAILMTGGSNDVGGDSFAMLPNHRSSPVYGFNPAVPDERPRTRLPLRFPAVPWAVSPPPLTFWSVWMVMAPVSSQV